MVVKKSCVAACPVEWPDGRGISGRMRVEWVAGSAWNRWSDAHGMGGQMTVESAHCEMDRQLNVLDRLEKPDFWVLKISHCEMDRQLNVPCQYQKPDF